MQIVHLIVEIERRRVAVAHWPLPKKSFSPRSSLSVALVGIEPAGDGSSFGAGGKSNMFCICAMWLT